MNPPFFTITSAWGNNQKTSNQRLINIITGKVKHQDHLANQANIWAPNLPLRKSINVFLEDNRSQAMSASRNGSRADISTPLWTKKMTVVQSSSRSLALRPMSNKKYRTMVASSRRPQTSQQLRKSARKVDVLKQLKNAALQKQIFRNRILSGAISRGTTHSQKRNNINNQEDNQFLAIQMIQNQKQAVQNASRRLSKEKHNAIKDYKVEYQAFNYLDKVFEMPQEVWKKYVRTISRQKHLT